MRVAKKQWINANIKKLIIHFFAIIFNILFKMMLDY